MKIILISIILFFLNCTATKVENKLNPLLSYIVSFRLYPISSSLYSINLNSSNLPGTLRAVIRANGTTYGLIENDTNSNILTLYQSSDGINFSNTGHSFDSTSITGNKNNLIFISNTLHYVSLGFSISNGFSYSYLTYTSNNGWSAINTLNYTNAPNSSTQLNCIYYFNNTLYLSLESKIMSLDITNGNLTDLNSSPGYSGPRAGSYCFVTDTSVYLSGGYRTGGSSTSFTDFYKSDDGLTFIKKTNTLPLTGTNIFGVQLNNGKLVLCGYACTTSNDNGENWSTSLTINVNGTYTSTNNIISNITDGEKFYLYSSSGKVYYGSL